jgi:hypothetical protein
MELEEQLGSSMTGISEEGASVERPISKEEAIVLDKMGVKLKSRFVPPSGRRCYKVEPVREGALMAMSEKLYVFYVTCHSEE